VATELLEKALVENADKDTIFTTAIQNRNGKIIIQDSSDVDEIVKQRLRAATKRPGGGSGKVYGESSSSRTPAVTRRRLGDVTRDFGGMDVSDDDDL
jgi:hypothetical protein